jgi:hypothetical protein
VANHSNMPAPKLPQDLLAALVKPAKLPMLLGRLFLLSLPRWRLCMISNKLFDGDGVFLNMQVGAGWWAGGGCWVVGWWWVLGAGLVVGAGCWAGGGCWGSERAGGGV